MRAARASDIRESAAIHNSQWLPSALRWMRPR